MTAPHVLIPVKALGLAKTRLARVYTPGERADLALAMFEDTLDAALHLEDVTVTVVTGDPDVARAARARGAHVLADPPDSGTEPLNAALSYAAGQVRTSAPEATLVALQADLPAVHPSELAEALAHARRVGRAVVVDHTGAGTSALVHCFPDRPFEPRFGSDSAARHIASGARALEGDWPGLRLDVDTGADLEAAVALGVGPATTATLDRIGLPLGSLR
ncbi:2-phospho-L-lactate guanylyltransferase [Rhodococcus sp. HM1]|uniref:2-phospho-L-lactate guanylyltransferase n=1 Tax=unclassified Rhodococcus (in: high G+C Gram-positive bacteria) TaxID=192944 RepID=UPI0018CF475C|nr:MULTISPECIES: 2-phospho-L-lactate guanylyltransferase [unclassified Rhodococcus (in: high G+C Gram-positive bacteria)]MBH0120283.1 2-phospho-L-lactate guanylyltransferase [Rhodococcus sp. CX]MCK8670212.1 2-phospho-L-lactate guanylyltransferase [Rhodococcus sp. HM1]